MFWQPCCLSLTSPHSRVTQRGYSSMRHWAPPFFACQSALSALSSPVQHSKCDAARRLDSMDVRGIRKWAHPQDTGNSQKARHSPCCSLPQPCEILLLSSLFDQRRFRRSFDPSEGHRDRTFRHPPSRPRRRWNSNVRNVEEGVNHKPHNGIILFRSSAQSRLDAGRLRGITGGVDRSTTFVHDRCETPTQLFASSLLARRTPYLTSLTSRPTP